MLKRCGERSTVIRDIWDGDLLKELMEAHPAQIVLWVTCNTDGVSINACNQKSIWPIQLHLDNLPPRLRFMNENVMVIGLFVGDRAPEMNSYFFPFLSEMSHYAEENFTHEHRGKIYNCKPMVSHCVVDLQAKNNFRGSNYITVNVPVHFVCIRVNL